MNRTKSKFLGFGFIVFVVWVFIEAYMYNIAENAEKNYMAALLKDAKERSIEIEKIREWNAELGGVYVKSKTLKPNKYLDANLVDFGEENRFVKINPAWMMRMLSEKFQDGDFSFALVSSSPVNPLNKAKGFYAESLQKLHNEASQKANPHYQLDKDTKRLEYLHPIYMKKACMGCHQEEDYTVHDLRGGIALDLDASFYMDKIDELWKKFYLVSALFTVFTFLLLYAIGSLSKKSVRYELLTNSLQEKIAEATKKLDLALKGARLGYWHWNIKTHKHDVDERWLAMLGLYPSAIDNIDTDWSARIHPDDKAKILPIIEKAIATKEPYTVEFRMLHANGEYIWIEGSGDVTKLDENGEALELSGTHKEIGKRKALELEHKKNELYLQTLYEKNPNMILITTGHKIIKANEAFLHFFKEYTSLEAFLKENICICNFFQESKYKDTIACETGKWIDEVFAAKDPMVKIVHLGDEYYFSVYAKKIYEENEMHVLVTFNDITEMYKIRHMYEELSIRDALTGIYNRRFFNEIFPHELNRAKRVGESFCFAILDVDNFKLYNDNYGHDMGDVALQKLAEKVEKYTARANEYFFRLGGEEFGVIFSGYTKEKSLYYLLTLRTFQFLQLQIRNLISPNKQLHPKCKMI
ncbi:diguanylate cyclase [Sulfurimonas sp.]|uniref:diguanylate cyclase n=1 Tax=Sulfurimonas sp. TaxID=2022749 RepID=UPI002602A5CB|nr:diguanylate cyclase [Sulfurimonas sp.]